jgi:hypothetical protein
MAAAAHRRRRTNPGAAFLLLLGVIFIQAEELVCEDGVSFCEDGLSFCNYDSGVISVRALIRPDKYSASFSVIFRHHT